MHYALPRRQTMLIDDGCLSHVETSLSDQLQFLIVIHTAFPAAETPSLLPRRASEAGLRDLLTLEATDLLPRSDSDSLVSCLSAAETPSLLPREALEAGLRRVLDGLADTVIDAPKAPQLVRV